VTLTGERDGYYAGYQPGTSDLARVIERGWLYEGQASPAGRSSRGRPADELSPEAFVYCIQNHDQVGNRALGARLCHDADLESYCLASVLLLFLPMTPLIFMGQEWAASTPFLFFTDHEPDLGARVTAGRHREFAHFAAFSGEQDRLAIPDPQDPSTFERSKLVWEEARRPPHSRVLEMYCELLHLRQRDPVLSQPCARGHLQAKARGDLLAVVRDDGGQSRARLLLANFGSRALELAGAPWYRESARPLFSLGAAPVGRLAPRGALILAFDPARPDATSTSKPAAPTDGDPYE
jgi:maltooligosyltrehalose trehalohydrolase